ncbi:RING finger protein 157 [Glycine soja]|nr:RING finger protein 157 [Glycine soja]
MGISWSNSNSNSSSRRRRNTYFHPHPPPPYYYHPLPPPPQGYFVASTNPSASTTTGYVGPPPPPTQYYPNGFTANSVMPNQGGSGIHASPPPYVHHQATKKIRNDELYGIGSSTAADFDDNDPGKECVICMTEPKDTAVLTCRHMCMCGDCAKALRPQSNKCLICRQPIEELIEIKINNGNQ